MSSSVGVKFRMLSVSEINVELLFGPRIEAPVSLICEVVDVKNELDETRFGYERLRLFRFTAEYAWLFTIAQFRLGVAVYDL